MNPAELHVSLHTIPGQLPPDVPALDASCHVVFQETNQRQGNKEGRNTISTSTTTIADRSISSTRGVWRDVQIYKHREARAAQDRVR